MAPVDWTSGSSDLRDLLKVLRMGLRISSGVVEVESVEAFSGGERRLGWVMRMSVMICKAIVCRAGWPLAKQWRKRVRFSWARFCDLRSV